MYVQSKDLVAFVLIDESNDSVGYVTLNAQNNALFKIGFETMTPFSMVGNRMNHVIFTSTDNYRFVGGAKFYGDGATYKEYNKLLGYVMTKAPG